MSVSECNKNTDIKNININNGENSNNITLNKDMNEIYNMDLNDNYINEKLEMEKEEEKNIEITAELINKFVKKIINNHNIIISTCSTTYDEKLIGVHFKYVLIDEATQCCEIEALLPIMHGSRYVVMIGDQKQLGPTIIYPKADLFGMKIPSKIYRGQIHRLILFGILHANLVHLISNLFSQIILGFFLDFL